VPVAPIEATAGFELLHVAVRSVKIVPAPSRTVATMLLVCPTWTAIDVGSSDTVDTDGRVTTAEIEVLRPSQVAVIVVCPIPTAVSKPEALIVATAGLLEVHTTAWGVTPGSAVTDATSC
jgi:hypothetical protein